MSRLPTGGSGHKRRIRTMLRSQGNVIVVGLNRSKKPLPANWRELLADAVGRTCAIPPRHFKSGSLPQEAIKLPYVVIAPGSLPTAPVLFVLERRRDSAALQRRAIEWSLQQCDVRDWPVPKVIVRRGSGGEVFVATDLYLVDQFVGISFNLFNPHRLKSVPGLIDWRHLRQYTVKRGKAELLGIRTDCGTSPCDCRKLLPDIWQLGWELQY